MFHLVQTRTSRYRFYDDEANVYNLVGYRDPQSAYSKFQSTYVQPFNGVHFEIIASAPDYDSFPQLYPEFFL